jgi:hypothetical protein
MSAELILILFVGFVLALILFVRFFTPKDHEQHEPKPANRVPNDKLVIIKGVEIGQVRQAVQQFCDLNNLQEGPRVVAQVTQVSESEIAVTFPYDIDFGKFCFFVNYMYYPNNIEYKTDIKGWATTKAGDMWVGDSYAGKRVMLYIPANNTDYDSVFFTTEENVGYKIGFRDTGDPRQIIPSPVNFIEPSLSEDAETNSSEEIS